MSLENLLIDNFRKILISLSYYRTVVTPQVFVGCEGAKAGVLVSRRELHTHIHLDYIRVEIIS